MTPRRLPVAALAILVFSAVTMLVCAGADALAAVLMLAMGLSRERPAAT